MHIKDYDPFFENWFKHSEYNSTQQTILLKVVVILIKPFFEEMERVIPMQL